MVKRKAISAELERELHMEAGWRCAIPTCRVSKPLDMAHIEPVQPNGETDYFNNMIILCKNCHARFDDPTEKRMTREAMIKVKNNLMIINGRYSHFEMRVIEYFSDNPEGNLRLFGREFDVMYLVKDGLIKDDGKKMANAINFPPKDYLLTPEGKDFINKWRSAELLDT